MIWRFNWHRLKHSLSSEEKRSCPIISRSALELFYANMIPGGEKPLDPHWKFSPNNSESYFSSQRARRSTQVYFYSGLSSFFIIVAFVIGPYWSSVAEKLCYTSIFAQFQPKEKSVHCKKKISRERKKPQGYWRVVGGLPLFLSHARKVWSAGAGIWQSKKAVMSAILEWTVPCAACRHLSSFSSQVA